MIPPCIRNFKVWTIAKTDTTQGPTAKTFRTVLREHTTHTIWPTSASRVLLHQQVCARK